MSPAIGRRSTAAVSTSSVGHRLPDGPAHAALSGLAHAGDHGRRLTGNRLVCWQSAGSCWPGPTQLCHPAGGATRLPRAGYHYRRRLHHLARHPQPQCRRWPAPLVIAAGGNTGTDVTLPRTEWCFSTHALEDTYSGFLWPDHDVGMHCIGPLPFSVGAIQYSPAAMQNLDCTLSARDPSDLQGNRKFHGWLPLERRRE